MQRLGGLAAGRLSVLARDAGGQKARQRILEGIAGRRRGAGSATRAASALHHGRVAFHVFAHAGMDELITMARDGADERRLPRIVSERAPQAPHGLGQRAVGDDDVAPRRVHDVAP